jgi:hypothetical protein
MGSTGRSIRKSARSGPWRPSRTAMAALAPARMCIHIGWPCAAGWVRGGRGLWWLQSRCACVLSASELAPECRAAPYCRRDLARMLRARRGPHGTLSCDWPPVGLPGSGVSQQRHEPPQGAARVRKETGGVLLSQALASQVPSALRGLTSLFGMGRGVSPSPRPPERVERPRFSGSFKTTQRHKYPMRGTSTPCGAQASITPHYGDQMHSQLGSIKKSVKPSGH